jgi:hypothetical protein
LAALQGTHQLAQKSISTTFPFKEESLTMLSTALGNSISGTVPPILSCACTNTELNKTTVIKIIFLIYNIFFFEITII